MKSPLHKKEILESKTMLEKAAEETGWNVYSMLDILCDYMNENCDLNKFKYYLGDMIEAELTELDPEDFDEDGEYYGD